MRPHRMGEHFRAASRRASSGMTAQRPPDAVSVQALHLARDARPDTATRRCARCPIGSSSPPRSRARPRTSVTARPPGSPCWRAPDAAPRPAPPATAAQPPRPDDPVHHHVAVDRFDQAGRRSRADLDARARGAARRASAARRRHRIGRAPERQARRARPRGPGRTQPVQIIVPPRAPPRAAVPDAAPRRPGPCSPIEPVEPSTASRVIAALRTPHFEQQRHKSRVVGTDVWPSRSATAYPAPSLPLFGSDRPPVASDHRPRLKIPVRRRHGEAVGRARDVDTRWPASSWIAPRLRFLSSASRTFRGRGSNQGTACRPPLRAAGRRAREEGDRLADGKARRICRTIVRRPPQKSRIRDSGHWSRCSAIRR